SNSGELPKQARGPARPVLAASPVRLPDHTSAISALRWTADGKYLASAGLDRQIMVWFVQQRMGTPMLTVMGHEAAVKALSWSTDGQMLASAADDGSICLWHLSTTPSFQMETTASWRGHDGEITTIEWAPVSPLIASGGRDQMLLLWDK